MDETQRAQDSAHKTAISRNRLSAPAALLQELGLLRGRILDFGCGKGFDARELDCDAFDPHFQPERPEGFYDTIMCNYVLNVVKPETEMMILSQILSILKPGGNAFIAVRRDVKEDGFTSKGTYQRNVELPLPMLKTPSHFAIYRLRKDTECPSDDR